MALTPGALLGQYRLTALIGEGGMGRVWRAHHIALNRDDALKVLPDAFASDPDRLARFRREAQVLASLNHQNIARLYGLEQAGGVLALVMELVEGPTLADRMMHGPMPVDDALAIARQIAEALEAAHEQGIVHRDLKPANVKVREDGTVKVLDFGLAKAVADAPADVASHVSTVAVEVTHADGVILGTAPYMSPEQTRGRPLDKRTDIWAFGCVLYQMLTGSAPFTGPTMSDTIAAILEREPAWTRLPAATPAHARTLLRRCLEKDPRRRLRDIGDARLELEDKARHHDEERVEERSPARRLLPMWTTLTTGVVLGAIGAWTFVSSRPAAPVERPTRFSFTAPDEAARIAGSPVSSPDGRHITFVARNGAGNQGLWVRSLDSPIARRISGTDGAIRPFWSPDARFIGFGVPSEGRLKKVELATGVVQNIASTRDSLAGGTWGAQEVIVFGPDDRVVLHRVSASGGASQPVTALDATRRENSHRWPHFLPDGLHFLFTARSDVRGNTGIYVASLDSTERAWLVEAQSAAAYAAGHLLFVREGTLLAQRFDAATLRLSGQPFALASNVAQSATAADASFSVSADGSVVVHLSATEEKSELAWFDRRGGKVGATIAEGDFQQLRLSPDGTRAAVVSSDRDSGNRDIWLLEIASGALTRLTSHPSNDWQPVWSPDGKQIAFASDRDGLSALFRKPADGSGSEAAMPTEAIPGNRFPDDWSTHGGLLAVHSSAPETSLDVWIVPSDSRPPYAIARSTFQEHSSRVSPDGRWIAYVSDESGRLEVYVQPVGKGAKRRVSISGGVGPRWRGDGRELFFIDASNTLMVAALAAGETLDVSTPVALYNSCRPRVFEEQRYEVAADGTRSLWLCPPARVAPSVVNVSMPGLPSTRGR